MGTELTAALCALAAFALPLGIAWLLLARHDRAAKQPLARHKKNQK